ncbi:uncharacterized protein LOC123549033 [Mercenaria mercenaria]|uniref:uncharacterized protein LOC123549033 n=1 Tax=Mercenaria mercenaria TaxID=6596 RepID=UPI00234E9903|nr:uncharacterized protein LOC123549033 [Mercenaria mercenaria]
MATGRSGNEGKLIEAARRCDGKTLEALVKEGKVNLNVKDKVGCTAVHLCCKSADLVALSLLLEHGARTDIFDNSGMAPIHYAAMKDYIETMAVLVSYGADVNIQSVNTKQTPLHMASLNKNTRSINFLLYCGADTERTDKSGNIADLDLSKEERHHHEHVRAAFRDGHIKVFGKMINSYERWKFKSVGMSVSNTSMKCKQFSLFCRKMLVANNVMNVKAKSGVSSYLKDGIELVSDIYEYLVNQAVEEVCISVPVYTASTDFDTVYILDSTGSKIFTEMKSENETLYCSAWMTLKAYEDTVYSFAVVMETKSDTFTVTGMAQTLTSSVKNEFKVQLPEGCLPKNSEVSVKVIPTTEYQTTLNTELIKSTSHFCEVKINQKNRRALAITLPVPSGVHTSTADDTEVTVFHSDEATQTPSDWKEIDSIWRPGSSHVTVTDKSINRGTCIVTEVPKKKGNNILYKIKEFVAWLYDTAFKRKANVCFFAVTKYCSEETYRLLVGISDAIMVNEHLKTMEEKNYIGEYSQKSSDYLITPGSKFDACWNSVTESAKGSSSVSLIYQRQTLSHQDFVVTGKEHDFLQVTIFKRQNGNVGEEDEKRRPFTQINVELLIKQAEKVQDSNYSSLLFTEYPDNRFLSWLAQEIGHEWMIIGIGLGLKFSYLESIERDNTPTKTNLTMLYTWRTDQSPKEDLGLTALLHTLALAQRKDLVTKINKEVQELLTTKPRERVCRWIQKLSDQAKQMEPDTEEGLDDVDGTFKEQEPDCKDSHSDRFCINCLTEPEQAASPLSEIFLVHIATIMGSNLQLILQLGLPQSVINEIRHTIREPTSAMFKCLLLAQRRYHDIVEFFKDLMEGLKMQGNIQTVRAIKDECKNWFKINRSSVDKQVRKLEQVMDRY